MSDAFAHVIDLGNYAVGYRITGVLQEDGKLITKRHELKAAVLDTLHEDNIEIMTPSVMNQRPMQAGTSVLPQQDPSGVAKIDLGNAEKVMFDKSELAARINRLRERRYSLLEEIETLQKEDPDARAMDISWRQQHIQDLDTIIANFDEGLKEA